MYNHSDFYLVLEYPEGDFKKTRNPRLYVLNAKTAVQARLRASMRFADMRLIDLIPITLREWEPSLIGTLELDT